jgi:hypothetical protein
MVASEVLAPPTISTSGTRCGGLKGWPMTQRSGCRGQYGIPLARHDGEKHGCIPAWRLFLSEKVSLRLADRCLYLFEPVLRMLCFEFTLDEGTQALLEQVQRLADAFVIADRHDRSVRLYRVARQLAGP